MDWKDIVSYTFLAIIIGLMLKNGSQTTSVIESFGKVVTNQTKALNGSA
jgi:Flp pilus assembly protein TadB